MPPNNTLTAPPPVENIPLPLKPELEQNYETLWGNFQTPLKWTNVVLISTIHILAVWGLLTFPYITYFDVFCWEFVVGFYAGFGVTGGAHRYWTHRSFKAKTPLKIILLIAYATSGHNKLYHWVRDHRVHHKFSETNADPHNANRGFFFSHVGWLMMKKHPDVIEKGKLIDCSDLFEDPFFCFFERFFWQMQLVFCFALPIAVPYYLSDVGFYYAFISALARYVIVLNMTWSVNSFAHLYGNKPYDQKIQPVENQIVSFVALGEGWHNYHHTFPNDYKTSEFGSSKQNVTAGILDFFGSIGWAYDFKTASPELVQRVAQNHGDGSHFSLHSPKSH